MSEWVSGEEIRGGSGGMKAGIGEGFRRLVLVGI